jgi:peptidoglycan/LPS O-acetylase OafA/YrhL
LTTSAVEVSAEPRAALDRLPALDGLRGLAILLVMFYHYGVGINHQQSLIQHVVWSLSGFGWTGVDLFFVLSGFLITRILLQSRDADNYFSSFYARRFLRICPIYYVSLFVLFLVVPLILRTESAHMPSLHERLWYFAYLQNWLNVFGRMAWPIMLTHYWSLGVEEQFYLIWPLIIYCLPPKRLLQSIIAACIFSLILRLTLMALLVSPETIYRNTFTRMDALFIGAACALLIRNELWTEKIRRYAAWLCFAPLVTLAALRTQPFRATAPTELGLGYTVIALSYAALLIAIVTTTNNGSILQRFLSSGMMRAFGKYLRGIHLAHADTSACAAL